MDGASFDPAQWSHWLLIGGFIGVSVWGLSLSWQWRRSARLKRQQAKLARRLAIELHDKPRPLLIERSPVYKSFSPKQSISTPPE